MPDEHEVLNKGWRDDFAELLVGDQAESRHISTDGQAGTFSITSGPFN